MTLNNFHLVSKFPFMGKIVENVVGLQLQKALEEIDY